MKKSSNLDDTISNVLRLEGMVAEGMLEDIYRDIYEPKDKRSFLNALLFFLGRAKALGYIRDSTSLYLTRDGLYGYFTPSQAELLDCRSVGLSDIESLSLEGKNIMVEENSSMVEDSVVADEEIVNSYNVERRTRIPVFNIFLIVLFGVSAVGLFYPVATGLLEKSNNNISKSTVASSSLLDKSTDIDNLFTSSDRKVLREDISPELIDSLYPTLLSGKYSDEAIQSETLELNSIKSYLDLLGQLNSKDVSAFTSIEYVHFKDSISSISNESLKSKLRSRFVDMVVDREVSLVVTSELYSYPTNQETYTYIKSSIDSISGHSPQVKQELLSLYEEVKSYVIAQGFEIQ